MSKAAKILYIIAAVSGAVAIVTFIAFAASSRYLFDYIFDYIPKEFFNSDLSFRAGDREIFSVFIWVYMIFFSLMVAAGCIVAIIAANSIHKGSLSKGPHITAIVFGAICSSPLMIVGGILAVVDLSRSKQPQAPRGAQWQQ